MDCEVVDPDYQYWQVDGEDPEHENEEGMGVIVEVVVGPGALEEAC